MNTNCKEGRPSPGKACNKQETPGKEDIREKPLSGDLEEFESNLRHREMKKLQDAFVTLLGFGVAFALRIIVVGVLLGGWIDRKIGGGKGYWTLGMIVFAILFSFYMLYRELTQKEKNKKR